MPRSKHVELPATSWLSDLVRWVENTLSLGVLAVLTALPIIETAGREGIGRGISGSIPVVQHLTLWITLVGAAIAARSDRLLALSTGSYLPTRLQAPVRILTYGLASAISSSLALASWQLTLVDYEFGAVVAWGIPVWAVSLIMPLAFAMICLHMIWHASPRYAGRAMASIGLLAPVLLMFVGELDATGWVMIPALVIVAATALGMPIFAAVGGLAVLLFWVDGTPISAVPGEAYRMATSPMLPAIPLFTLAGYILAEGGSSKRLLRLFTAFAGWIPGGLAIATTVLLAFFTPLTGASGVTILAMGGLLLPLMVDAGYPDRTAVGLVTVSGSIGVLLPPSLPVILYAYYADVDLRSLFLGGALPGMLLIVAVAAWGGYCGWVKGAKRTPFSAREAVAALWVAKWEALVPVAVLAGIFGGVTTLVEAAALTVLYALIIAGGVHRELSFTRDLPKVAVNSTKLVGGFMIILGVALGLTSYLIMAEIPMRALAWVRQYIDSPALFLLALNVLLIIVGALMDIYSAIIVIVPLITPIAAAYGIHPVHLGVLFMANMQLGFLMPPMGENLFLAAYRFEREPTEIMVAILPYVAILLVTVLVITYVPALTLWPLEAFGGALDVQPR